MACKFVEIQSKLHKKTNEVLEENPPFLVSHDHAMVKMVPLKALCVEKFQDYASLGRFAVRDMNRTIAIGIVKSVERKKEIKES